MSVKLSDLILHKKEFLTSFECDLLIEEYNRRDTEHVLERCPEANTGIDTFSTFKRIDLIHGTPAFDIVHSATERMINFYHDYLDTFGSFHTKYRESLMYSHMYRLLKYETGAKIHPHTDHDPFVYGSCTFNLNDNYTGGDFSFWNGKHKIKLEKGDALIFPADHFWVHEVEPIESGFRYSTNSFLQKIPTSLKESVFEYLKYNSNPNDPKNFDGTRYNISEKNLNG
jgi:hypothetical protein